MRAIQSAPGARKQPLAAGSMYAGYALPLSSNSGNLTDMCPVSARKKV